MMNDLDLNVKIVVDKSSVKRDLNDIKQDIGSVSDKTRASAQSATSQITGALKSVKAAVGASIGSTVASFVGASATVRNSAKAIRKEISELSVDIADMFKESGKAPNMSEMLAAQEEAYKEFEGVVGGSKSALDQWRAQWEMTKKSFTNTGPLKAIREGFSKLKETITNSTPWQKLTGYLDKIKNSKLGLWFRALGEAVKEASKAILGFVAALATLGIALLKNANAVSVLGDEIDKGAQRLNMSTQQYQKWSYAMELCGSSIEEMREGYNQMSTKLSQAINGTEDSAAAFEKLGVNIHDSNGELRTTGDIFEDTIAKLQRIENPTERIAVAQQFFGESTAKLNPLLNSEAGFLEEVARTQRALNSEMSGGLVSASAKYRDAITTMKQAWQGLRNTLAETVLPVLQRIVVWLTVAIAKVNIVLRALFGLKNSGSTSMDSATKSTDGYTASVNKATKAVEKLKRQTMGFDEMNILQSNNSSGSGNEDISGGISGEMGGLGEMPSLLPEDALADIEAFEKRMDEIGGKVQGWATAIGIVGGALLMVMGGLSLNIPMILAGAALFGIGLAIGNAGGFDEISKAVGSFADSVGGWLGPILMVGGAIIGIIGLLTCNIPMAIAGIALAGVGLSLANGDLSKLGEEGESTSKVLLGLIPNFIMVAGAIGGVFCLLRGNIIGAIACFAVAGVAFAVKQAGGVDELAKLASQTLSKAKTAISNGLKSILTAIQNWWTNLDGRVKGILTAVGGFFTTAFGIITRNGDLINKGLGLIKDGVNLWWSNLSATTQNIIKGIGGVFETIVGLLTGNTTLIKKGLDNISNAITGKKFDELVKGEWEKITKWWTTNVSPKFTKQFWADKFNSIKEGARSAFNGVIGVVEKAVNGIIKKLNTLNWKIPDWVPGVGGKNFGFSIKQISIPRLATGGIATRSTIANIGENGKEAILPLERNTQWMDMLADRLSARSGNVPTKLVLMVDKKVLGEASIEGINNITRETGALQLVMV